MSATVVLGMIATVIVVLILFAIACVHYLGDVLSDVGSDDGHGGTGH